MKIPLTPYGYPELFLWGTALVLCSVGAYRFAWWACIPFLVLLVFLLSFFRDPDRAPSETENVVISPADGVVDDIADMNEQTYLKEDALRIGIFMSVFNVHVNRAPCEGTVEFMQHVPGGFMDARRPQARDRNERQYTGLMVQGGEWRLLMCQVAGAIARRIVCKLAPGQKLAPAERIGMVKFGSRVEVYIPKRVEVEVLVKKGDKARAGVTPLVRIIRVRPAPAAQETDSACSQE